MTEATTHLRVGLSGGEALGMRRDAIGAAARFEVPAGHARDRDAELREAAEQFVASHLLMPLMNELREQPLDSEWLDGGLTEDAFGKQLDTILADRIVKRPGFPLVEAVYERMAQAAERSSPREVDTHG